MFPPWDGNPYLRLLYGHLSRFGIDAEPGELGIRWLLRKRTRCRVLHFHWPQPYYRSTRRSPRLARLLSWRRLALFSFQLAAARSLGYRIVWTVHQVLPHEILSLPLDRLAARSLARLSNLLLVHDDATAARARAELGARSTKILVVPHGSYAGVYPPGRPRTIVRAELGIPDEAFVLLCFGSLRGYKDIELLLDAFARSMAPARALVIAGTARDEALAATVEAAAARDARIKPLIGYVSEGRVAELYAASDVAVVPRGDGGTSGSLVLALSLGVPAIAADRPAYSELLRRGKAGWLFRPEDAASLAAAIEQAAGDPRALDEKAGEAVAAARSLSWPEIGERIAARVWELLGRR